MQPEVKQFYSTVDFDVWATKSGLNPDEKYIIETYLDKNKKTVDAGTGGGRILLEMQKMGFTSLYGYDIVPELIAVARQKDLSGSINFEVGDVTSLNYEDSFFEQILYIQQILSVLNSETEIKNALKEAYRILQPGGTALFSFISFETTTGGFVYNLYLIYLSIIRKISGSKFSIQYFPYNSHGGKFNLLGFLLGKGPYLYRYKLQEAYEDLQAVGFQVIAISSREQISQGIMYRTLEEMRQQPIKGAIYFVCKK
jgi:ubiquinone/menaquinone biosynthesis C-methylase UbiE